MTFLHMHHAMANKALTKIGCEAKTAEEYWHPNKTRLREIVMSGSVDYKCNFDPATITDEDREIVCKFLNC